MKNKIVVIKPQENCGMCGYIWQTLRGIYHNPNKKYYIDFSNSIYKPKIDDINVWDRYFEQPHISKRPNSNEIEKEVGIIFDVESAFIWSEIQPNTEENIRKRRQEFNSIIKKYVKLKKHVQQKIDDFVKNNFEGKRVLGVHFRGTDHPEKKNVVEYMQTIKDQLINYDVLFVASDDYERFRLAEVAFKNKIVSYDSIRSKSKIPLHNHQNSVGHNTSEEYQYKIGEDVIIEAYLLSKVDHLLCCPGSNVNYLARVINPVLSCKEL